MKWQKINADEVVPFKKTPDATYASRLLTGDVMAAQTLLLIMRL